MQIPEVFSSLWMGDYGFFYPDNGANFMGAMFEFSH
jgi:hypothetical protein